MNGKAWPKAEEAVLEAHVTDRSWFPKVREMLPHRSAAALRKRMVLLRASSERGGLSENDNWQRPAAKASQALLQATLAVGRWS